MKNTSLAMTALLSRSSILITQSGNSGAFASSRLVLASFGYFSWGYS